MNKDGSKTLSARAENDIRSYLSQIRPDFITNASMANLGSDGQLAFEVNYRGPVHLARVACMLKIPYIFINSAATLPCGVNLQEDNTCADTEQVVLKRNDWRRVCEVAPRVGYLLGAFLQITTRFFSRN